MIATLKKLGLVTILVLGVAACGGGTEGPRGAPPVPVDQMPALARQVAHELNIMRRDPAAYAVKLQAMKSYFAHSSSCPETKSMPCRMALPGEPVIAVRDYNQYLAAIDEAIDDLRADRPALISFAPSRGLKAAAGVQAADRAALASSNPHIGSNGSTLSSRVAVFGTARGKLGEAISFGRQTAFGVVSGWLVDLRVQSRAHRKILLDPNFEQIGITCAPADRFGIACVADFAQSYIDRSE